MGGRRLLPLSTRSFERKFIPSLVSSIALTWTIAGVDTGEWVIEVCNDGRGGIDSDVWDAKAKVSRRHSRKRQNIYLPTFVRNRGVSFPSPYSHLLLSSSALRPPTSLINSSTPHT